MSYPTHFVLIYLPNAISVLLNISTNIRPIYQWLIMGSYKKIGLSHEKGLIDTPLLIGCINTGSGTIREERNVCRLNKYIKHRKQLLLRLSYLYIRKMYIKITPLFDDYTQQTIGSHLRISTDMRFVFIANEIRWRNKKHS